MWGRAVDGYGEVLRAFCVEGGGLVRAVGLAGADCGGYCGEGEEGDDHCR